MAIAYVNSTTATTGAVSSTSLTINVPSGLSTGQLMIAIIHLNAGSATVTAIATPTGWTAVDTICGTNSSLGVFYRYVNNEPASYVFTWTGGTFASGSILVYSGTATSSPIDVKSRAETTTSGGVYSTNSVTTTQNAEMLVTTFVEQYVNGSFSWTRPAGETQRSAQTYLGTGGIPIGSILICDEMQINAGATGQKTASTTDTSALNGQTYIFAIKMTGPFYKQTHFMFYNDGASINSATALSGSTLTASLDTDFYDIDSARFRIRIQTANTGVSAGDITRRLEFKEDSGEWTQITTNSNNVRLALSSNFADGDVTTSRLTSTGTFTAGKGKESGSDTTQISLTNDYYTEDEWCVEFQTTASGHIYQFRVTNAGIVLDQYDYTPILSPIVWIDIGGMETINVSDYSSPSFELRVNLGASDVNYPVYARLYNITDDVAILNSVGTDSLTVDEYSTAITLTGSHQYKMQVGVAKGGTVKFARIDGSMTKTA